MNIIAKQPKNKKPSRFTYFLISLAISFPNIFMVISEATAAQTSDKYAVKFQDLSIQQVGSGKDILFIPGLNSSADTFTEVCDAFKQEYRCHLLQLPGFAGAPALPDVENGFLSLMQEQILAYIEEQKLKDPIIVGHSLGGFLALQMASTQPDAMGALIIVDSLPFLPAVQFPGATVERMESIAGNMKRSLLATSEEQYLSRIPQQLMGMTRDNERLDTLIYP